MSNSKDKKLLDRVRDYMRVKHYSIHTERTYCDWIKRYITFHKMTSVEDLNQAEKKIEAFLTWLAVENAVAPSTQNQAMNGPPQLIAKIMYGCGLRIMEAVRLRILITR